MNPTAGGGAKVRLRAGQRLSLTLPAAPELFPALRAFVGDVLAARGLREEEIGRITLALQEAVTNVHRHAYHGRSEGVRLEVLFLDGAILVFVEDRGPPFDPTDLPLQPLDSKAEGGRGIALIRTLMDEVRYEDGGREVRMRKRGRAPVHSDA